MMKKVSKVWVGMMSLCLLLPIFPAITHQTAEAAPTRLGLHVTQAELDIWRDRAVNGPYKSAGDVSTNSPGEWDRIVSNKNLFMSNPSADLWSGPAQSKSAGALVGNSTGANPTTATRTATERMLDAAFYAMVEEDSTVAAAVKDRILDQFDISVYPKLDFGDRDYWAYETVLDLSPNFIIAEWITSYIHAMDYIEILNSSIFSAGDRSDLLDNWERFADVLLHDTNYSLDQAFEDRPNEDYSPANGDLGWGTRIPYYNPPRTFARAGLYYNNRRMTSMAYVGLIGVHQDITAYKEAAKKVVKEYVMFCVFPEGYTCDFYRYEDGGALADKGLLYGAAMLGSSIYIADLFARTGDTSLYDFVTTSSTPGAAGSEGAGKSLLFAATSLAKYLDGTYERYGTDESSKNGNPYYRIDDHYGDGKQHLAETRMLLGGNTYYNDSYLKSIYMRTASGTNGYATNVDTPYWRGSGKFFPSVLFMFGQMEGVAYDSYANLAAGLTATGSSTISNATRITDGIKTSSLTTYAQLGTAGSPQWIVLDLGESHDLNKVKLWHYYSDGRTYHDVIVQVSNTANFSSGVTTVFNNDANNSAGQGTGSDAEYAETSSGKEIAFSSVNGRYVRLWSNGSTSNTYNHYVEVEVWGAPANLAAGLTATGSSTISNATRITDGIKMSSLTTYAQLGTAGSPQWIVLDLGESHDLNKVKLWHYYSDGRTYHDVIVQVSNTANFSSGVTTVFNNDTNNSAGQGTGSDAEYAETSNGKEIAFSSVNGRYVRLWSNGSTSNTYNHYVEVEVWAS